MEKKHFKEGIRFLFASDRMQFEVWEVLSLKKDGYGAIENIGYQTKTIFVQYNERQLDTKQRWNFKASNNGIKLFTTVEKTMIFLDSKLIPYHAINPFVEPKNEVSVPDTNSQGITE